MSPPKRPPLRERGSVVVDEATEGDSGSIGPLLVVLVDLTLVFELRRETFGLVLAWLPGSPLSRVVGLRSLRAFKR